MMQERQLLLTVRFRGTHYHGYQVQPNGVTVAQVIQDAVERVFGSRLDIKGCSRTDAGVHANGFCLSLHTVSGIPCDAVVRAMNVNLPDDVAVIKCREVSLEFHPRYDCTGKRYLYQIYNGPVKNPFLTDLALFHKYPLDERRMDAAARSFLGTHDFSAFCSAGSKIEDSMRTIQAASVTRKGEMVTFSVTGDGFLYNMVRIMTGTLLDAARGIFTPEDISRIIEGRDRAAAGATAPAHGLYLDEVFYEGIG